MALIKDRTTGYIFPDINEYSTITHAVSVIKHTSYKNVLSALQEIMTQERSPNGEPVNLRITTHTMRRTAFLWDIWCNAQDTELMRAARIASWDTLLRYVQDSRARKQKDLSLNNNRNPYEKLLDADYRAKRDTSQRRLEQPEREVETFQVFIRDILRRYPRAADASRIYAVWAAMTNVNAIGDQIQSSLARLSTVMPHLTPNVLLSYDLQADVYEVEKLLHQTAADFSAAKAAARSLQPDLAIIPPIPSITTTSRAAVPPDEASRSLPPPPPPTNDSSSTSTDLETEPPVVPTPETAINRFQQQVKDLNEKRNSYVNVVRSKKIRDIGEFINEMLLEFPFIWDWFNTKSLSPEVKYAIELETKSTLAESGKDPSVISWLNNNKFIFGCFKVCCEMNVDTFVGKYPKLVIGDLKKTGQCGCRKKDFWESSAGEEAIPAGEGDAMQIDSE
ncbi:hypothetical protein HDU76_009988 [Blyttiomyces sp. JEL0837]|nr:hypothetical protein HDU76_009988 [Blyttiomyces sp. JEL0837]